MATLGLGINASGMITGGKQAEGALNSLGARGARLQDQFVRLGAMLGGAFGGALFMRKLITETSDAQYALAQVEAAIKSTGGAAGRSATQLADYASHMQRITTFSDEAVMGAQSLLLTFNKIKGDTMDEATKAAANLATRMGGDLQGAAIQLGKALQDPERGLLALRRSGVSFTEAQTELIKKLFETGRVAEGQRLILKELEYEFGGAAEAARNTLGGALVNLKNQFGELFEATRDGSNGAINAINKLSDAFAAAKPHIDELVTATITLTAATVAYFGVLKGAASLTALKAIMTGLTTGSGALAMAVFNVQASFASAQIAGTGLAGALGSLLSILNPFVIVGAAAAVALGAIALAARKAAQAEDELEAAQGRELKAAQALSAGAHAAVEDRKKAMEQSTEAWQKIGPEMQAQLDRQRALNAAHGEGALSLDIIGIKYDAMEQRRKNAIDLTGQELIKANALTEAIRQQRIEAATYAALPKDNGIPQLGKGADDFQLPDVFEAKYGSASDMAIQRAGQLIADSVTKHLKEQADRQDTGIGARVPGVGSTPAAPNMLGRIGGKLSGMLNPETILSGLATGGISTAIGFVTGAVSKFVGGMLTGGREAKRAAEAMAEAQANFGRSMAAMRAEVMGTATDLTRALARSRDDFEKMRRDADSAFSGRKNEGGRAQAYREIAVLEAQRIEQLKAEAVALAVIATQDLEVRRLRAAGYEEEAAALRGRLDQQREYDAAVKAGMDAEYLAALKLVQGAEAAKSAADATAAAAREAARLAEEAARLAEGRHQTGEDIGVLRLRLAGQNDAADAYAREAEKRRELLGIADAETRALIEQRQSLQDLTVARQKESEALKALEALIAQQLGVVEDSEVLRLRVAGQNDAADAAARETEKRRELLGVTDESLIAFIKERQALQDLLAVRQKEIELIAKLLAVGDDINVLQQRIAGHDNEAAAIARINEKRRELAGITDKELVALIKEKQALEDVWAARQKELEIIKIRTQIGEDVGVLRLRVAGLNDEADAMARTIERRRELMGVEDDSTRVLIQERQALQDVIAARQKEIEVARSFEELRRSAFEAQSTLDKAVLGNLLERDIARVKSALDVQVSLLTAQVDTAKAQLDTARDQLRVQEQAASQTRSLIDTLTKFSAGLKLGPLTTLSPIAQMAEARRQFEAAAGGARSGDKKAAEGLPQAAQALLDASRAVNASGLDYVSDFRHVQTVLDDVTQHYVAQLSTEEKMLAELQAQTVKLQEQIDATNAMRAQAEAAAQKQIEALTRIHDITLEMKQSTGNADLVLDKLELLRVSADAIGKAIIDKQAASLLDSRNAVQQATVQQVMAIKAGAPVEVIANLEQVRKLELLKNDYNAKTVEQISQLAGIWGWGSKQVAELEAQRTEYVGKYNDQINALGALRDRIPADFGGAADDARTQRVVEQATLQLALSGSILTSTDAVGRAVNASGVAVGMAVNTVYAAVLDMQNVVRQAATDQIATISQVGVTELWALLALRQAVQDSAYYAPTAAGAVLDIARSNNLQNSIIETSAAAQTNTLGAKLDATVAELRAANTELRVANGALNAQIEVLAAGFSAVVAKTQEVVGSVDASHASARRREVA